MRRHTALTPTGLLLASAIAVTVVGASTPGASAASAASASPVASPTVAVARDGQITYADPRGTATHELTGTLTEYVVESAGGQSTEQYAVQTAAGALEPVEVRGDLPARAATGKVTAEVTAAGRVVRAEVEPSRPSASVASGAHRAYVAKVTNAGSYAADDAAVTASVDRSLQRWVVESDAAIPSFDRVGAVEEFAPTGACSSATNLWNQAVESFPGVRFGSGTGNHLVVLAPPGCVFGVGTVGSGLADGGRLALSFDPGTVDQVLVHEIGHNLGLRHTERLQCAADCTSVEYGDDYNVMGLTWSGAQPTALSSAQRGQLGLTGACEAPSLALAPGQRSLAATYDVFGRGTGAGTRGLVLTDPTTSKQYALDWRNRAGRDAEAFYGGTYATTATADTFGAGLTVQEVDGRKTTLLPSAEATAGGGRAYSREAGESFTTGGVQVSVDGVDGTGTDQSARVRVTLTDPAVTSAPALPEQSGSVTVAGTTAPGAVLTAVTDGWTSSTCFRYRWLADGVAVPGARAATYTVPADRAGQELSVQVVGQAPDRAARTVSSTGEVRETPESTGTDPAEDPAVAPSTAPSTTRSAGTANPGPFARTVAPRISGKARLGRSLTVSTGTWAPNPTTWTYQWRVDGTIVAGATHATYKVGKVAEGRRVTVTVTGTRSGYVPTSQTSAATAKVR